MSKTWRTIVVFAVPAAITVLFWWTLGSQLGAKLSATKFQFFGNEVSLEAVGPTAVYFVFLFIAAQLYPLDEDELMPIRRRLKGKYLFKLVYGVIVMEGELNIQIDKEAKRLSINGKTKDGRGLTADRRIVLRDDYLAFVMDAAPGQDKPDSEARYFIECTLAADEKMLLPLANTWSRVDGDGYGTVEIKRA